MQNNLKALSDILNEIAGGGTITRGKKVIQVPSGKKFLSICRRFLRTVESDARKHGDKYSYDGDSDDDIIDTVDIDDIDDDDATYKCFNYTFLAKPLIGKNGISRFNEKGLDVWTPQKDLEHYSERVKNLIKKYKLKDASFNPNVLKCLLNADYDKLARFAKTSRHNELTIQFEDIKISGNPKVNGYLRLTFRIPNKDRKQFQWDGKDFYPIWKFEKNEQWHFYFDEE